jgi:hypothetical protein
MTELSSIEREYADGSVSGWMGGGLTGWNGFNAGFDSRQSVPAANFTSSNT